MTSGRCQSVESAAGAKPADDALPAAGTLTEAARAIVAASDVHDKCRLARATAKAWYARRLGLALLSHPFAMPERPGRPARPELRPPRDMPRRRASGARGRFALLHALAHIELNAVDMTWDLVARFAHVDMPRAFYDDWVQVGLEEAKHFGLLQERLRELGGQYGDLPAHDGRIEEKVDIIEAIDEFFLANLVPELNFEDIVLTLTADHSTPCMLKAHSADPVPLLIMDSSLSSDGTHAYSERECAKGKLGEIIGVQLLPKLIELAQGE